METLSSFFSRVFRSSTDTDEMLVCDNEQKLTSDANAGNPNKAWKKRLRHCHCSRVKPVDPRTPVKEDHVRFVCISDTHTRLETCSNFEVPAGDVLLHAGDFSMFGIPDEVDIFNKFLGKLPHKYKVVIAGNHDNTFDLDLLKKKRSTHIWSITEENYESRLEHFGVNTVHEMLTDCIYLQDSMTEIYGIKIYGSPWTPGRGFWGFQRVRGPALIKKWNQIPADTDILLTHCPPCGFGDKVSSEDHVGCVDLLNTVQKRVKPKYHVYGHIHEGYGIRTDGTTTYINASTCTESYKPKNPAIVFDVPLPPGYSKIDDGPTRNGDICNNAEDFKANFDEDAEESESSETCDDSTESDDDVKQADTATQDLVLSETSCLGFTRVVEEEVVRKEDETANTGNQGKEDDKPYKKNDAEKDTDTDKAIAYKDIDTDKADGTGKGNDCDETSDSNEENEGEEVDDTNNKDDVVNDTNGGNNADNIDEINQDNVKAEEGWKSSDDIFSNCSMYSEGDSISASNNDGVETADEDSDIVFYAEPELDSGGKYMGEKHN